MLSKTIKINFIVQPLGADLNPHPVIICTQLFINPSPASDNIVRSNG
jgi:hypothetical protein